MSRSLPLLIQSSSVTTGMFKLGGRSQPPLPAIEQVLFSIESVNGYYENLTFIATFYTTSSIGTIVELYNDNGKIHYVS